MTTQTQSTAVLTAQKDASTTATIASLWIAPEAAKPMEPRKSLVLIPGVGAEGDRYALTARKGCYSARFFDEPGRHLTMVSGEGFLDAAERAGLEPMPIEALRRNVVLRGISIDELNATVGHEVRIGACRLFVHRRNVPCKYREAQCRRPGLRNKLWDACGVCCEILPPLGKDGGKLAIKVGDAVAVIPDTHNPKRINVGFKPPGFFVRPEELSLEDVKKMIIPPFVAAVMALWDPEGFMRVERAYNDGGGVLFWSPKAYAVGKRVGEARTGILAAVFVTLISVAVGVAINVRG